MFGTCAGCIMLSKSIDGMPDQKTLQLVDMTVNRSQTSNFASQKATIVNFCKVAGTRTDLRWIASSLIYWPMSLCSEANRSVRSLSALR